jgi:hypothetical protein
MLPNTRGEVTPADQVGGGVRVDVQVFNNHPTAQVTASADGDGRTVRLTISEAAAQIRENRGELWSALKSSTNVRSAL